MTQTTVSYSVALPLRVGIVGTGYAARLRAETCKSDPRTQLVVVAGHSPERTQEFSQIHGANAVYSWQELIQQQLDLVIVSNVNRDHGAIARAALETGKHVIVEYPLALDVAEAESLLTLATTQNKLLHVEHIELLGGVHQALKAALPEIGTPFYARYTTIKPECPAPQRWSYHPDLFGFPLMAALSRLHRLTDLFGTVAIVHCQSRFWQKDTTMPHYAACLCSAQLQFHSGVIADVTYGKGETFWQAERRFEVTGERGALLLDGDQGVLVQAEGRKALEVGSRRGLFARDTAMVLDHLFNGVPLYTTPTASVYTLKVADAARRSALTGQAIAL